MADYLLKNKLPFEIVNLITDYLPYKQILNAIKNKEYIENGFWFKRVVKHEIVDIKRTEISYYDWYKIFHYKDYSMLIKYENCLIKKLVNSKTKEYIQKLHENNLENCHKRHFMSYKYK